MSSRYPAACGGVLHYEKNAERARCPIRNNPETYIEFCVKIHEIFQRVAKEYPDFADKAAFMDISKIESTVKEIINVQAPKEGRIDAWKRAAWNGLLFGTGQENILDYDENVWHNNRDSLKKAKDSRVTQGFPVYRFYQAAAVHRINILTHILPVKELIVA
ncbi:MAG TPA: hypothetical protein ENL07_09855 [Chlorobaculum parvum]|uniref:Uncharacterized protein n=1 Tax=Chlorobaculum parvum TaxID=274539 RepID=A0A7C5HNS8_9CHLB|nr:hypothetical protein [Chlorobaculum parvum]